MQWKLVEGLPVCYVWRRIIGEGFAEFWFLRSTGAQHCRWSFVRRHWAAVDGEISISMLRALEEEFRLNEGKVKEIWTE